MSAINTDGFAGRTLQAAGRAMGTGFAAEQSADGLFDKQLRMAIKPAESKDRAASDDGALRRPEPPANGGKPEKTKGDSEPVGNENAEDGADDVDQNESRPGANENAEQNIADGERGENETPVADGETAEMLDDGSGRQGPWPNQQTEPVQQPAVLDDSAAEQPAAEPVPDPRAAARDESAKTDPANHLAEATEAKGEVEKAGLAQAQAPPTTESELNADETGGGGAVVDTAVATGTDSPAAVETGKPNVAPAEVSVNQDVAKQSQAAAEGSENKETAEQEKDRRATGKVAQNVDGADKRTTTDEPTAANAQQAGGSEVRTVEKTEPIAPASNHDVGDRDMGDTKRAAVEPVAATAPGQRGEAGRETQTGPPATSGEATDPVDRVRFVQRVARAFESAGRDGGTLRIRLHPAELGTLRLDVAIRNGVMTAKLETETQAAKNVLLDNMPALRDRLEQQNIKIERFDVDYEGGNNDQPSRNAADGHQHKDRLDGQPYGSPSRDGRETGADESREMPRARRIGEASQLDVVA